MTAIRMLYRDPDRAPFLYTLQHAARQRGVDLTVERVITSQEGYAETLLKGEADFLAESYWNLQLYRAQGAPIKTIATNIAWRNETLVARPGVQSLEELRGGRLAIRGVGPCQYLPKLWIEDMGIQMEPVVVTEERVGRWGNWRLVLEGDCVAGFVSTAYVADAIAAGLSPVAVPQYGCVGNIELTTTASFIQHRQDDCRELVQAMFDALRMFKHDLGPTMAIIQGEPLQLLREARGDIDIERWYQVLRDEMIEEPVPTAEAISNTHRMLVGAYPELADFNPLLMWDLRFVTDILDQRSGVETATGAR